MSKEKAVSKEGTVLYGQHPNNIEGREETLVSGSPEDLSVFCDVGKAGALVEERDSQVDDMVDYIASKAEDAGIVFESVVVDDSSDGNPCFILDESFGGMLVANDCLSSSYKKLNGFDSVHSFLIGELRVEITFSEIEEAYLNRLRIMSIQYFAGVNSFDSSEVCENDLYVVSGRFHEFKGMSFFELVYSNDGNVFVRKIDGFDSDIKYIGKGASTVDVLVKSKPKVSGPGLDVEDLLFNDDNGLTQLTRMDGQNFKGLEKHVVEKISLWEGDVKTLSIGGGQIVVEIEPVFSDGKPIGVNVVKLVQGKVNNDFSDLSLCTLAQFVEVGKSVTLGVGGSVEIECPQIFGVGVYLLIGNSLEKRGFWKKIFSFLRKPNIGLELVSFLPNGVVSYEE